MTMEKIKGKYVVCECVSEGHPDKMADWISDNLVDAYVRKDPYARCGIETMVKDNIVVLGGEVHSSAKVDVDNIVRDAFAGNFDGVSMYPSNHNLAPDNIKVINLIGKQSSEIHSGVDKENGDIGAGDQGFMVGYACSETPVRMPLGMYIATHICQRVSSLWGYKIGPDTKTQVTVLYDEDGNASVERILVSTMHQCPLSDVRAEVLNQIKGNRMRMDNDIFSRYIAGKDITIDVNPCGTWNIGGSVSDCGVTGRKIVVDHYGGYCNVGGGAFSGKDLTKVDRSGAYMARYLAKNIVESGIADTAKVTLSYTIGVPEPSSVDVEIDRNEDVKTKLLEWIRENVDLRPAKIIERFASVRGYLSYSSWCPFGLDAHGYLIEYFPWEKTDIAKKMRKGVMK